MTRLVWDEPGSKIYETGVDRGVLFPRSGPGVPWVGLVAVNEEASGGDITPLYFDGVKYMDIQAATDFEATIEAYSAPSEFGECDGTKQISPGLFVTQQPRKTFGFSYRTLIGNDLESIDYGYKLHIVYNATAAPANRNYATIKENFDAPTKSWKVSTVPPPASLYKPTAHFVIDSTKVDPYMLQDLESYLYGRDDRDANLLTQDEVVAVLASKITEPITEPI